MHSIRELFKTGYGPSSSHTVAPGRGAGIFARRHPGADQFTVTLYGSLAATGRGHGTDTAIRKELQGKKTEIIWEPETELPLHPNGMTFQCNFPDGSRSEKWTVYSTGGGDLEDESGMVEGGEKLYPLCTMDEILDWCRRNGSHLWEYVEACEGAEIWDFLAGIWETMKDSIKRGLENEGSLPGPLQLSRKAAAYNTKSAFATGGIKNKGLVFSMALAVAEENAAGGRVVTAPTCGSSGVLPAALAFAQSNQNINSRRLLRGLAIAGLIGNIVKTNGSISGAEVGCQGEIGTACAMTAGALTYLLGGSPAQTEYAAEMGFEHYLGLTCDPVGGYVQIPCIERNAFAADTARECAVFALFSDGSHHISFDQVVATMMETGRALQSDYRETGRGGLARHWKPLK